MRFIVMFVLQFVCYSNLLHKHLGNTRISPLIKTITKFSNVIRYQQPDLSINWTVAHALCRVNFWDFQHS